MDIKMKRVDRTLVYQGSILDIYTDKMEFADGHQENWDLVAHRMGAAAVLPVREDGKILMVEQYRNALERMTLEIPAGARDSVDEPTIVCASRELEEETGYRCENLEFLLTVCTTVAFCNEKIDIYLAKNLIPSKQNLDDGEEIEVKAYDLEELSRMIYEGTLQDSKTVAAILAYQNTMQHKM